MIEDKVIQKIKERTKDYDGVLDRFLYFHHLYYIAGIDPDIFNDINIKLKHNLSHELEVLDAKLAENYGGHIDFYEAPFLSNEEFEKEVSEDELEARATEAFTQLINPDKSDIERLMYFYCLMMIFVNAILSSEEEKITNYINYEIFDVLKPYVVAKKLRKEFTSDEISIAQKSVTSTDATAIDASKVPPYLLMDNSALVVHDGDYYLVEDILKAITAAGGVAQTLERQDLEGGMTNASRQGKSRRDRKKDVGEHDEDTADEDSSGISDEDDEDKSA